MGVMLAAAAAADDAGSRPTPAPITASPENPLTSDQIRIWSRHKAGKACKDDSFLEIVRVTPLACQRHVEDWHDTCTARVPSGLVFTDPDEARQASKAYLECALPPVNAKPAPSDYA